MSQAHADAIFETGAALADLIADNPTHVNSLVSICGTGSTGASLANATCLTNFVNYYGRKIFRRPITAAERTDLTGYYNGLPASDRLALLIARLLVHPMGTYALDNSGTRLSGTDGVDATYQLTNFEQLSKITFLFWAAPPDDGLYDLVANLDLSQSAALNQVLDRVLSDSRARIGLRNFYSEWLKLERIPGFDTQLVALQTLYGSSNPPWTALRDQMATEVLDLTEHFTFNTAGRYEDLLNTNISFARGSELASIYGVAPWSGSTSNFVLLPAGQRSGLLTRGAFLVSGSQYTRPIIKGKLVRTQILCETLPPPPPAAALEPLVQNTTTTTRDIVHNLTSKSTCISCHSQMNPLGFASENYDSLGRFRTREAKFDPNGTVANYLNVSTETVANTFSGDTRVVSNMVDLSNHIASSGKGAQCMTRQYFRFVYGRQEDEAQDGCSLESMRNELTTSGTGSIIRMFREVTRQAQFRTRRVK